MEPVENAHIRAYRGFLRHVIPQAYYYSTRNNSVTYRRGILGGGGHLTRNKPRNCCAWCHDPVVEGVDTKNYHNLCAMWLVAAKGQRFSAYPEHQWVIPKIKCPCGTESSELDHIVPIKLAVLQTIYDLALAFTPLNLQWLCVRCHIEKTKKDLVKIARRRKFKEKIK